MIILMGIQGAGKSVQGTLLAEKTGYKWLSTGEYLRANITGKLKEEMLAGKLLDDQELIDILKGMFEEVANPEKAILDGFPRTLTQAEWLYSEHQAGSLKINHVLYFYASREVVKDRLVSRARKDDTEAAIDKRFDEFEKSTLPVIAWLKEKGINVQNINAEGSVESIHQNVLDALGIAS